MILRYLRKALSLRASSPPSTLHFSASEFASRGEPVPRKYWRDLQRLMDQLEVLREYLGGPSVKVTSGWRSKTHNDAVGSNDRSQHRKARAADIKAVGYSPKEVADAIERLIAMGAMQQGGLGRYPRFTHYDVRRRRSRWGRN